MLFKGSIRRVYKHWKKASCFVKIGGSGEVKKISFADGNASSGQAKVQLGKRKGGPGHQRLSRGKKSDSQKATKKEEAKEKK